jgi:hypothetical protein
MKEIALKIIGGRKLSPDFKCHHFAYQFVRSIVPEEALPKLSHIENWPENLSAVDQFNKNYSDGSYVFGDCKNFE